MKAGFSMMIGVAALLMLSASFADGQQMTLKPTSFFPGLTQMGGEYSDPPVRILQYGTSRDKRNFAVGEPLNISIQNTTGEKIWYVRRVPPGVNAELLPKEFIRIQRLVDNEWVESPDQYATLIDDPDGQSTPQKVVFHTDVTILRKWKPHQPGQYRVKFIYYIGPKGAQASRAVYSKTFTVYP